MSLARSLALTHNLSLFRIGDSHERQPSLLSCYIVPYYVRTTSLVLLPGGAGQVFFSLRKPAPTNSSSIVPWAFVGFT